MKMSGLVLLALFLQMQIVHAQQSRVLKEITVYGSGYERGNRTVYHTNHPLVNDDVKPWYAPHSPTVPKEQQPEPGNSHFRLEAVKKRMIAKGSLDEEIIKETLRSKDNQEHPVCRRNQKDKSGFTFASVIMTLSDSPSLEIVAGPPDEAEYSTYFFKGQADDRITNSVR